LTDARHEFGGEWTELKLEAISAYSQFFTGAIGGRFDLWYVDPFAGTGERTAKEQVGGLLEQRPVGTIEKQYPGSAARALSINPPFDHFRFGDSNRRHVSALEELISRYPDRDAAVIRGDANGFIQDMFGRPPWSLADRGSRPPRALVFLDPYGLEVKWQTLEVLARSQKADVWYLVNLKAALQQLARKHERLDASKRAALFECFGTENWEDEFYKTTRLGGLFGEVEEKTVRTADKREVATFQRTRLAELFAYVSEPLALTVGSMDDYFLLYCMSNNPSPAARKLIDKGASWVIQRYNQASRYKARPSNAGR